MICLGSFRDKNSGAGVRTAAAQLDTARLDAAPTAWRVIAGRGEALDRAVGLVAGRIPQAVFVMAGPGVGKSTFLRALTEKIPITTVVERIHASPSLKYLPFGILAPYTAELTGPEASSPVAVLRSVWTYFQRLNREHEFPPVLVVDDAHHLDESSAAILADLVTAGWSNVVLAACPRPGLPQPLYRLWHDSFAERIDLYPLDRQELSEALATDLDSTVPASFVQAFWQATEGNPLLVACLLRDARTAGILGKRNGQWQLIGALPADGPELTSHVARAMSLCSDEEQVALRLIALSGSVSRSSIEVLCGAEVVRELIDQYLVADNNAHPAELRIRHPVVGGSIRKQVSASRSLHLRLKLQEGTGIVAKSDDAHLRNVEWALESGQAVADADMLRAAITALKSDRSAMAVQLAGRITSGHEAPLARAVSARARFNMGDYAAASTLLQNVGSGLGPGEKAAAGMLGTAASMAAGLEPEAAAEPNNGELNNEDPASRLRKQALWAEELADRGSLQQALEQVKEAAATAAAVDNTLYFFEELVMFRTVWVYLGMGEWAAVERELERYSERHSASLGLFEGTTEVLRGYSYIRQGKMEQACQTLVPASESLRRVDPLQLHRFAASLAFFAAARMGDKVQAMRLAADIATIGHLDPAGLRLRADAYLSAGREYCDQDGIGLAALLEHCDRPEVAGRSAVLLEIMLLCAELGDKSLMKRIASVAEGMDGTWPAAAASLAKHWQQEDANVLMEEGERLAAAGFANLAREAYLRAGTLFQYAGDTRQYRHSLALLQKCEDLLGLNPSGRATRSTPVIRLTRRERDIAELAAQGLADKEIAHRLMVSVRTVEGHLYRTYVKLGVRSRSGLLPVLPFKHLH